MVEGSKGNSLTTEQSTFAAPDLSPEPDARARKRLELLKADDAQINFYGKVEDTEGVPLSGVEVLYSIVKPGSFAPSLGLPVGSRGKVTTHADGRFAITGESGVTLSIDAVTKPGYHELRRNIRSFGYGSNAEPHVADDEHPVVFVMAKEGGEKALKKDLALRFDWDGTPVEIAVEFPGLKETIRLIPRREDSAPGSRSYPWSLQVSLVDGGVTQGRKGEPPLAPLEGYVESLVFEGDPDQAGWSSAVDENIYARSASGKYFLLKVSAYSNRSSRSNTGWIDVISNPSGGRVFE